MGGLGSYLRKTFVARLCSGTGGSALYETTEIRRLDTRHNSYLGACYGTSAVLLRVVKCHGCSGNIVVAANRAT